jgi:hypothetical protein
VSPNDEPRTTNVVDLLPTKHHRNYDGVEMADLRQEIDHPFNALHDALEICYYQHWRQGQSAPFGAWDVQPTMTLSKALFDRLHGLIFDLRELYLDQANQRRPAHKRYDMAAVRGPESELQAIRKRVKDQIAQGFDFRGMLFDISGFEVDLSQE